MARVNIHLPDELHEKVQKQNLNVSGICQEALSQEVKRQKEFSIGSDELEKLKIKVLEQQQDQEGYDLSEGHYLAKDLAKKNLLNYQDFVLAEQDRISLESQTKINQLVKEREEKGEVICEEAVKVAFIWCVQAIREEIGLKIKMK